MIKKTNKISGSDQKKVAHNWGKPKEHEKHVRVPEPPEDAKYKGQRKYKVLEKKPHLSFHHCPFCLKDLPPIDKPVNKIHWLWARHFKKCECGARNRIKGCPCCHGDTWFDRKTGIFKHNRRFGCGFSGKALVAKT